jgi:hypothetical protein
MKSYLLVGVVFMLVLVGVVNGLFVEDDNKLDSGHAVRVVNVSSDPENLVPGSEGILRVNLQNGAKLGIEDVRVKLELPDEIKFYKDVDKIKFSKMESGDSRGVSFRVIVSPSAKEGIYDGYLKVNYVSFFGATAINVGNEKEDNFTLGIIVKSEPILFIQLENSEIYRGNNIGDISVKFVNNGLADLKFLTVELEESDDYEIISGDKKYIGDLDSDDFDSVKFRLKANGKRDIKLPLKIDYKDSLNQDYTENVELSLILRSAKDLGIDDGTSTYYVVGIIVLFVIGYFVYKRFKKKGHHGGEHRHHPNKK